MNLKWKNSYAVLALAVSASFGAHGQSTQPAATNQPGRQSMDVADLVKSWPEDAKKAVDAMTKKYGAPNEATPTRFIWLNNGPWKETIVSRDPIDHQFPMPHKDVMEQVIDYRVPPDKFDDLAAYDGSVIVERTKGTMSARCDKEEANFLALNLAHDVVTGKKNVSQARAYYARAMKEMMAGKIDPYLQKLQFPPQSKTADADQPAKMADAMGKDSHMMRKGEGATTSPSTSNTTGNPVTDKSGTKGGSGNPLATGGGSK